MLELVLGIDNLVFIAILADKLPPEQRDRARVIGLSLALLMRLGLLASISWMVTLTEPLIEVFDKVPVNTSWPLFQVVVTKKKRQDKKQALPMDHLRGVTQQRRGISRLNTRINSWVKVFSSISQTQLTSKITAIQRAMPCCDQPE